MTTPPDRPRPRVYGLARGIAIGVAVVALAGAGCSNQPSSVPPADAGMNQRAAQVMPFDLNATTHTFTDTADGGVEQVVANNPTDTADITAIRGHLTGEAAAFARGDYRDPATIHGQDMPGLSQLEAGAARVKVTYTPLPAGAQITYRSDDPTLVEAIHAWFARQRSDHSMPGMGMGR